MAFASAASPRAVASALRAASSACAASRAARAAVRAGVAGAGAAAAARVAACRARSARSACLRASCAACSAPSRSPCCAARSALRSAASAAARACRAVLSAVRASCCRLACRCRVRRPSSVVASGWPSAAFSALVRPPLLVVLAFSSRAARRCARSVSSALGSSRFSSSLGSFRSRAARLRSRSASSSCRSCSLCLSSALVVSAPLAAPVFRGLVFFLLPFLFRRPGVVFLLFSLVFLCFFLISVFGVPFAFLPGPRAFCSRGPAFSVSGACCRSGFPDPIIYVPVFDHAVSVISGDDDVIQYEDPDPVQKAL